MQRKLVITCVVHVSAHAAVDYNTRSGDVIHPQLRNVGSRYETNLLAANKP